MSDENSPTRKECIVLRCNHFDPLWRRCWDRDFYDSGRRFVSYRVIEEAWIDDAIASCEDGSSCFMVEASWVLRHYLELHPERLQILRALAREGRFELLGSGENIVDANMIHGELLARNLILGTLWAEKTLGVRPSTGWHADGFGSSAQMPQIFRQCGYRRLPALSYNIPDAPYWRGLDGSVVLHHVEGRFGGVVELDLADYIKYAPCPDCGGEGCDKCAHRGFPQEPRAELKTPTQELPAGAIGVMSLGGEEILPGRNVSDDIARFNARSERFEMRQGTYHEMQNYIAAELALADNPPASEVSSKVENNPIQTGCYVSRIRAKQEHRAAEHALFAAERWDTLLGGGSDSRLRELWKDMTLSAFHDAITGTHIDPANEELLELLATVKATAREIEEKACAKLLNPNDASFTLFNSQGFAAGGPVTVEVPFDWKGATVATEEGPLPVYEVTSADSGASVTFQSPQIPALSACQVKLSEAPSRVRQISDPKVSCGRYTVEIGEHGITGVSARGIGPVADCRDFLLAELMLERDLGDPWCTRSLDRTRERLSPHVRLAGVEQYGDSIAITYEGQHPATLDTCHSPDPMVSQLTWRQVFHLRSGAPWIEVETSVSWWTYGRRLRLAFPSTTHLDRGVYEIPYGVLERDRYECDTTDFANAGGDWPALHWGGVQAPGHTFAVFNRGTPSYRIEDGTVLVSVLRSPHLPYALNDAPSGPPSYIAYNFNGMWDHGCHTFPSSM